MGNPSHANGFEITTHENVLELPLRWKKPQTIFVNYLATAGSTMGYKLKTGHQLSTILAIPRINPIIKPILVSEYGLFNRCHLNIFFIITASLLKALSGSLGSVNPINAATANANRLKPDNTFTKQIVFVTSMCIRVNCLVHYNIEDKVALMD